MQEKYEKFIFEIILASPRGTVNQMSHILGANGNPNKTNEDIWYAINMMQPRYGITEFLLAKDFTT